MNYSSWVFWLFFAALVIPYWRLSHRRQNRLLLLASYGFYSFWDFRFLYLILASTVVDFIGGLGVAGVQLPRAKLAGLGALLVGSALLLCSNIHYDQIPEAWRQGAWRQGAWRQGAWNSVWAPNPRDFAVPLATLALVLLYGALLPRLYALPEAARRKTFLLISLGANLTILGFFKYFGFFVSSVAQGLQTLGLGNLGVESLSILLPAGISFYTFQAMSYTVDIYRRQVEPTRDFADFALFICFFPHLVAGPIMRAHTLLPQVTQPRRLQSGAFEEGLLLVLVGLFKKLVVADNLAPLANAVFTRYSNGGPLPTGPETLVGIYAFAGQIYGDFSGYSSVARGISKWLGFELVVNFRMPYLAVSPSDFWNRWHISLSTWLRDYLYIPLGGNRGGTLLTYRNLVLTMLLGGLWHGASWTFVAWGAYQGAILCAFRALQIRDVTPGPTCFSKIRWAWRVALMFHLTCMGWLLFRADSLAGAARMLTRIASNFQFTSMVSASLAWIVFYGGVLFALEWAWDGENRLERTLGASLLPKSLIYSYLCLMLVVFHAEQALEFIYFQF